VRKYVYGALVTALLGLNTVLFFWRRSGGRLALPREKAGTPDSAAAPANAKASPASQTGTASTVTAAAGQPASVPHPSSLIPHPSSLLWRPSLDTRFFLLALLAFVLTRFIGLDRWPIYFFTDEAIQSVQAVNLVHNGFRDAAGTLFPAYVQNGAYFNLSVSVYAQVLPYLLFGLSVIVTRGVSVLIALSGAAAIGLTLRDIFKVRYWWIGTLLLSITPAFFLHSRTAFETVFGTSLYAWFLYFYLRYRHLRPRNLYAALLFGALAFYAYSPMQAVVVATGLGLLLSDLRYHLRHWRLALAGLALLLVLALPYLRFQADHPDESWLHLRMLNSYLLDPGLTPDQKVQEFWQEYTTGLSPAYWYSPTNDRDLIRHLMKDYGHLLPITLPFALIGLIICLRRFKSPAHRAILLALFITPLGGALAQVQVYRNLAFVIPVALLTALGLIQMLDWLSKRIPVKGLALGVFAILGAVNFMMLNDALTHGDTWYTDYTLGGLQYGGEQIFDEARAVLRQSPATQILVSPTWANGTDVLLQFFMPDEPRAQMGNIDAFKYSKLELNDRMLLVMTANEYQRTIDDPKFTGIRVEQTLKYPDGSDGFYFVRLNYSPQADAIFAEEDAARRRPVQEDAIVDGQTVAVLHSKFDVGQLRDAFDGDSFTLVRTIVDNPCLIELTFPEPRPLTGVTLTTGTMDFNAAIILMLDTGETQTFSRDYVQTGTDPTNDFPFDPAPARPIKTIRIEIKDLNVSGDAHLHVREIKLR
jgi:hypothetical protein